MERLLLSGPSLTLAEVLVVAAAFAFLLFTPLAFRFAAARRRPSAPELAALELAAQEKPAEGVPAVGAGTSVAGAPQTALGKAPSDEELWPTSAPPPSFDPWHPEEAQPPDATAAAAAAAARVGEAAVTAEALDERAVPAGLSVVQPASTGPAEESRSAAAIEAPPLVPELSKAAERVEVQRSEPLGSAQSSAERGERAEEGATEHALPSAELGELPVRTVTVLEPLPALAQDGDSFSLLELRRASLPSWPPPELDADQRRAALWRQAQDLERRFSRAILECKLFARQRFSSFTLAGAEFAGERVRLRYWLFPELWPVRPDEAEAVVAFDVDAATGPVGAALFPLPDNRTGR
jgi:hypothetical protein